MEIFKKKSLILKLQSFPFPAAQPVPTVTAQRAQEAASSVPKAAQEIWQEI